MRVEHAYGYANAKTMTHEGTDAGSPILQTGNTQQNVVKFFGKKKKILFDRPTLVIFIKLLET